MNKTQAIALLRDHKDERGMAHWEKGSCAYGEIPKGLKSYGIGLTKLRNLAKQIGRDHKLAKQLWTSDVYDVKVVALLIDDPKQITRDQVEAQVDETHIGLLAHVFSSCNAPLAKTSFAPQLAEDWIASKDAIRRRCGYGLIYELSKRKKQPWDDAFYLERITGIEATIHDEPDMWVRESMNTAMMGIGKRNKELNTAAIKAVKAIGPVDIDYGDGNACEPLDVFKHLTSDYVKKKLG